MSVFNGHANPLLKSKKVKMLHQYQRWTAYLTNHHLIYILVFDSYFHLDVLGSVK